MFIGLGSNLDDPPAQLEQACDALASLPDTGLRAVSSFYRSSPMGPQDQPDFCNAVAELETALEPEVLLDALQAIESRHGRVRRLRWGPRTLDLDLLVHGERVINTSRLQVPHPGLPERAFVLYPLAELARDLQVPGMGQVAEMLARTDATGIERMSSGGRRMPGGIDK